MPASAPRALFWFRRDLRLDDNHGLSRALAEVGDVVPVFIFDRTILDPLPRQDRRVEFIHGAVSALKARLRGNGSDLVVRHGDPVACVPALAAEYGATAVYTNDDYEPAAIDRDMRIAQALGKRDVPLRSFKDTVIHARSEVMTGQKKPYTVFTPYRKQWRLRLSLDAVTAHPSADHLDRLAALPDSPLPRLADLGFQAAGLADSGIDASETGARDALARFLDGRIGTYDHDRDYPAVPGTSRMSVHNRFGTISVRALVRAALDAPAGAGAETWLSELAWRDFYFQLLYHYPAVATQPFRTEYTDMAWGNDRALFAAWREGRTGFPIIDAAMTQLNTTGFMHNRLRMIVASFLTKDLLVDYRWGEAYFAEKLLDYDMAPNNGGWQWAASTGCDAQPYFRIFNPTLQSQRFDAKAAFIRQYLPVLSKVDGKLLHAPWEHETKLAAAGVRLGVDYPRPIVDHGAQRDACLAMFKKIRSPSEEQE
jgi:deoxyribodipyrimidine photo-lyase